MIPPPSPHDASNLITFPETVWTQVGLAVGDDVTADEALNLICRHYWPPIYAFIRQSGRPRPDAQDLTQGFFAELVGNNILHAAAQEKGRLRTFLLGALKRYLSNATRHANAEKRGGKAMIVSLDAEMAEQHFQREFQSGDSPDVLFERAWAHDLVARARERLEQIFRDRGKGELFATLRDFLDGDSGNAPYQQAAEQRGMSVTNIRTNVYRMRRQYREILEKEISFTVSGPQQAREELTHLMQILKA